MSNTGWDFLMQMSNTTGITREMGLNLKPKVLEVSIEESLGHLVTPKRIDILNNALPKSVVGDLRLRFVR